MGLIPKQEIPLNVVVCDPDEVTSRALAQELRRHPGVGDVAQAENTKSLLDLTVAGPFNTVFIDVLELGLIEASDAVFHIRRSFPDVVFVLYIHVAKAERIRAVFYEGERRRFSHYYKLDKNTPVAAFGEAVSSSISGCRAWLQAHMSAAGMRKLRSEMDRLTTDVSTPKDRTFFDGLAGILAKLEERLSNERPKIEVNTVFLSYRFAEKEYINGLVKLLGQHGFQIATGEGANTYVSQSIVDRIRGCEYFLCLMTRDQAKQDGTYTTSPWLLEEKGVAIAYGKPLVIMIEEGVTDFGGLQGDWQRIHFGPKGFLNAALQAVEQLESYSGRGKREAKPSRTNGL